MEKKKNVIKKRSKTTKKENKIFSMLKKTKNKIVDILTVIFLVPLSVSGFIFIFNSSYNFSLLFAALYLISTLVSKEYKNVS